MSGERRLRAAVVSLAGERVGRLAEIPGGTRFTYDRTWLARAGALPVSVTLPLRSEPYEAAGVHPFFLNLLPEGWLLEVSAKRLKISRDDAFGLVMHACGDCIGAVEVHPAPATG
jgi:serine/threonine-protein kinase HipA